MDPSPTTDIKDKTAELTNTFVNCIRIGCDFAKLGSSTELLETCKVATKAVIQFQRYVEGIARPYILYREKLQHWFDVLGRVMLRLYAFLSEIPIQNDAQHEVRFLFKQSLNKTSTVFKEFEKWILTSPTSYKIHPNDSFNLEEADPPLDVILEDFKKLPKWVLKQLCMTHAGVVSAKEREESRIKRETAMLRSQLNEAQKQVQERELQLQLKDQAVQMQAQKMAAQTERLVRFHKSMQEEQAQTIARLQNEIHEMSNAGPEEEQLRKSKLSEFKETVVERDRTISTLQQKLQNAYAEIDLLTGREQKANLKVQELQHKVGISRAQLKKVQTSDQFQEETQLIIETLEKEEEAESNGIPVEYPVISTWMTPEDQRKCFARLLLDPSMDFVFVRLLEKCYPATGAEAEALAKAVLQLFQQQGREMELLESMIELEVQRTVEVTQLFRGEEFPPRLIRTYSRLIGISFAQSVIGDVITEIIEKNITLEIDPDSASFENTPMFERDAQIAINSTKLQDYTQRFFSLIMNSLPTMPQEFIHIVRFTIKRAATKFPNSRQTVIASFIFLRFFCPCIASPDSFNFPTGTVSMPVRRTLLLISKCIQCLANGQKTFKEECLNKSMGSFLIRNGPLISDFIQRIDEWPPRPWGNAPYLTTLESLAFKKKAKLLENLETHRDLLQRSWYQQLETAPLTRVVEVIRLFQLEASVLAPQDANESSALDNNYEEWFGKRVSRSSFPQNKDHTHIRALSMVFLDSSAIVSAMVQSLVEKKGSQIGSFLIYFIATIYEANNSLESLIRNVVLSEVSIIYSNSQFLNSGISRELFIWYSKKYLSGWLQPQWARFISTIISENRSFETDRRKLKGLCFFFIDAAFKMIHACPKHLWEFCRTLANYTSQNIFDFIVLNLFSLVIQDPVGFKIIPKMDIPKNATSTFSMLSTIFRNMANNQEYLIGTEPFIRQEIVQYEQIIQSWLANEPQNALYETFDVSWNEEREAYIVCLDYIVEHIAQLDTKLRYSGSVPHIVSFRATDVLQHLASGAIPKPRGKLPLPAAPGQPAPNNTQTPPPARQKDQSSGFSSKIAGLLEKLKD